MPPPPEITVPFPEPLVPATFVSRPNRFVVRCRIAGRQRPVMAHLPDPGRLRELLVPDRALWMRRVPPAEVRRQGRTTKFTALVVQTPDGAGLVSLDTTLPNRLVRHALSVGGLPEMAGWTLQRWEYPMGRSRVDFLLARGPERMVLEVKSVTLVDEELGLFPDAVTARGTRHLEELAEIAARPGWHAAAMFLAQREDVQRIRAEAHIDPKFAAALEQARREGVLVMGRRCAVTLNGVTLGPAVPVD